MKERRAPGPVRSQAADVLARLLRLRNPRNIEGMARYGIRPSNPLGISVKTLRSMAREIGRDHQLALRLWISGYHEARILASIIDEPKKATEQQLEEWAAAFDSWDLCDQSCANLFERTPLATRKAVEWSKRSEEFVKRAGFTLIARLAVSDKSAPDTLFLRFFPMIRRGARDERNYVVKAVNWALRQIGKRNLILHGAAIETANKLLAGRRSSERWVATDALRELQKPAVMARLREREKRAQSLKRKKTARLTAPSV